MVRLLWILADWMISLMQTPMLNFVSVSSGFQSSDILSFPILHRLSWSLLHQWFSTLWICYTNMFSFPVNCGPLQRAGSVEFIGCIYIHILSFNFCSLFCYLLMHVLITFHWGYIHSTWRVSTHRIQPCTVLVREATLRQCSCCWNTKLTSQWKTYMTSHH